MNNEIINENNGILIEPNNALQLEQAMKTIIEDSEFRKKLSIESKLSANHYHVDNIFTKVLEIIS
jgi:glycosyltransferase involved in cell wall biosynthesis